jgi:hypothetical protein
MDSKSPSAVSSDSDWLETSQILFAVVLLVGLGLLIWLKRRRGGDAGPLLETMQAAAPVLVSPWSPLP